MALKKEIAEILMKGPVLKLHVQLIKLGYDIPEGELKKQYYGQGTKTALRDFQASHGLPVTGTVDDAVRNRIQQVLEEKGAGQDEPGTVLEVADLHRAFVALGYFIDEKEQAEQDFGTTTHEAVKEFQKKYQLEPTGIVDQKTAGVLLREWGKVIPPQPQPDYKGKEFLVSGAVLYSTGKPFVGTIRAYHMRDEGFLIRLGDDRSDSAGHYALRFFVMPALKTVNMCVSALDEQGRSIISSSVIQDAKQFEVIDLIVPFTEPTPTSHLLEGYVVFENGLPAENLSLRLYRHGFGGEITLLKETQTQELGIYSLFFEEVGSVPAGLEIRTMDSEKDEISLTRVMHNLGDAERLVVNLVAPLELRSRAPEYQRLVNDLAPHIGDISKIGNAREDADCQDLTLLNRITGWDARLIALTATAAKLSADPEIGLPHDVLYSLLRAGLPSNKLQLARVGREIIRQALIKVQEAGILSLTQKQMDEAITKFEVFANKTRLCIPAPGSVSTYGDFLENIDLEAETAEKFASLFFNYQGNDVDFWKEAVKEIPAEDIHTLQLQGKLAFLTCNSEPITTWLQQDLKITDPVQLVERGFYQADVWKTVIKERIKTTNNKSGNVIPVAFAGKDEESRLYLYAEDMARKVRLSYPTQVIAQMIEMDENDGFMLGDARQTIATFLRDAAGLGFRLGQTPVEAFIRSHADVFGFTTQMKSDEDGTIEKLKTLQRVYQITPSNEAMLTMYDLGFTSAYDVVAISFDTFMERFGDCFSPREQAEWIYRKAEQVSSVIYNLFTVAKEVDSTPTVYGTSPSAQEREAVKKKLIEQFPTMESLFGSIDFCECEHCRSVLSPAAYLVDLLQFLDPEELVWENFLADWKDKHGGEEYPYEKPYDALVIHRPDIPHIRLTCENTNVTLPYIDIVNEILEYYVENGQLNSMAARDTIDITTPELLAEPQNVISSAYEKLQQARYPLILPFDLPIETVRKFCGYYEIPLWRLLDAFNSGETLADFTPIFIEQLGLSPAEYSLFTNPDMLTTWYGLYGYKMPEEAKNEAVDPETNQRIDLNSAKALSRRLGVTYKELVEIIKTGFVNPKLNELALLYKLGATINDASFYNIKKGEYEAMYEDYKYLWERDRSQWTDDEKKQFLALSNEEWTALEEIHTLKQRLADLAASSGVDETILEAELDKINFTDILVLADPDTGCNFDETTLRYADGHAVDELAFLKINLFVRLWRKLGWTIEEVDRALQVFVPRGFPFDAEHISQSPLRTALLYFAHLKTLNEQVKAGKQSLLKLLTLWSPMATTGGNPLYAQLFLNSKILQSDPIFDDPLGNYLCYYDTAEGKYKPFYWDNTTEDANRGKVALKNHLLAVQGALGLTLDNIMCIFGDEEKSIDTAELSLENISRLYRYGLLAKALKLSIRELIALKQLSGLDPFKPLYNEAVDEIDKDYPFTQTLQFLNVVEQVKESGLKVEDLEYLLRHRFDETGKYRPNQDSVMYLLKTIAERVRSIQSEHAVPEDPGTSSEEALRQKLGLILPPDVVERFLSMLNGTVEFTATAQVAENNKLDPKIFENEPSIRQVVYDAVLGEQKLTYRGVLFDKQKNELLNKFPNVSDLLKLLDGVQTLQHQFFEKYLQKQTDSLPKTGFLTPADYDLLFNPELDSGETKPEWVYQQRARLAQAFLPFLQQRLICQFIVQTLVTQTAAEPAMVENMLTNPALLTDVDSPVAPMPLLEAFTDTSVQGLNVSFFESTDGTGAALGAMIFPDADTGVCDIQKNPRKPIGTNSGRFEGYFEVPTPGAYRFYVQLKNKESKAELRFNHLPGVFLSGTEADDQTEISEYLELKAGILYGFTLELQALNGGDAKLLVQGETLPKDNLSQLRLYPQSTIGRASRALTLLTKSLQLIQNFNLSNREVRFLLTHQSDFGINLSNLPTQTIGDTPEDNEKARDVFEQFTRLAGYAHIRGILADGTSDLIDIFENEDLENVYAGIAKLTRRDKEMVQDVAKEIFTASSFKDELVLQRLWDVLQIVERFGVEVASVKSWTQIVNIDESFANRFIIASNLKNSIKSRYDQEIWQRIAQPIFDKLRQGQRDALVAYVMQLLGFTRMEQLYEYFLIDPGMEPVVQTSRIRLAISSVQLFIQRCLLNLEKKVHPSVINQKQWEWMSRYRVWEANRKIFLFPENWLEPEFRDDKTYMFRELEGNLLQGDVSNDLVEDAFFNYLKKLEELARLEIVGMYCDYQADPALNTLHVIGRSHNQNKYFYRRYAHQMWTPWEPVTADIQGEHIVPVVWRDRLYVFWVTFMDKVDKDTEVGDPTDTNGPIPLTNLTLSDTVKAVKQTVSTKIIEVYLHWSEYIHGEWSVAESGGFNVCISASLPAEGSDHTSIFIHVSKEFEKGEERGVFIHLEIPDAPTDKSFYLASRNSPLEIIEKSTAPPEFPYNEKNVTRHANRYLTDGSLAVTFTQKITTIGEVSSTISRIAQSILEKSVTGNTNNKEANEYSLLPCDSTIEFKRSEFAPLVAPVFYQDNIHTFFIEPTLTERTIQSWDEWISPFSPAVQDWQPNELSLVSGVSKIDVPNPIDPADPIWNEPIYADARFEIEALGDWLLNPITVLQYGDVLVGPFGSVPLEILLAERIVNEMAEGSIQVETNKGSELPAGSCLISTGRKALRSAGLEQPANGLNIIGGNGLNSILIGNLDGINKY